MVVYIEKVIFKDIDDEVILRRYQNMQNHRIQFSSIPSSLKGSKDVITGQVCIFTFNFFLVWPGVEINPGFATESE